MSEQLLSRLKILDLSRYLPGPLATLMLADLGAEVLKVEDPRGGDPLRLIPPFIDGISQVFWLLNRNKRSLALNIKSDAGRRAISKLAECCDVLVEGFRPGVMERLGLGWEELRARNPALIYCSMSGYGRNGPDSGRPGHDINFCARGGVLALTGNRGGPPLTLGIQIADICGAWQALAGILGALYQRQHTGRGQHLDISLTDGVLPLLIMPFQEVLAGQQGWKRGAAPLDGGGLPGYGVFQTSDGRYLAVAALEPQFFQNLCRVLGLEELSEKFAVLGAEADKVREKLAAAFRTRTQQDWLELFSKVEACVEPVWEGDQVMHDPQLKARAMFPRLELKGASVQLMDTPLRLEGGHVPLAPAPLLGQHTRQALLTAGFSEEEIEELVRSGQAEQAAGD